MRSIWKGALTFGLVTIPVGLCPATARGDVSLGLLHAKDNSPISYRRVCAEENVEVPWAEIVKGYEYEKGQFVAMTEADFEAADVEATQTIDILAAAAERGRWEPTRVVDLMSALEASLKAQPKRDGARAAGRREAAASRKPPARRRAS